MKRILERLASEPYRLFFPFGILAAAAGVMMWPLLYAGKLSFYPGEAHTRMMIGGFMGAFVIGFLGTAFPRLVGHSSWSRGELLLQFTLWLLFVLAASVGKVGLSDAVFASSFLLLFAGMARRWARGNRDTPPPGFVMALFGILGASIAAAALSWDQGRWMGFSGYQFARLWLFQGFLLMPLLGITPYLLPRFFGRESTHSFDESPIPPTGWWPRLISSVVCALIISSGFLLEATGKPLPGHLLRAAAILGWFLWETPVFRRGRLRSTPGNVVRLAVFGLVSGTAAAGIWPMGRVGSLHLFFAAGLGLAVLAVATRVVLGHAGRHDRLEGRMIWLRVAASLFFLAAATRMISDFVPAVRVSHHIYAAWVWAVACVLWLVSLARHLGRGEENRPAKKRCPRRVMPGA